MVECEYTVEMTDTDESHLSYFNETGQINPDWEIPNIKKIMTALFYDYTAYKDKESIQYKQFYGKGLVNDKYRQLLLEDMFSSPEKVGIYWGTLKGHSLTITKSETLDELIECGLKSICYYADPLTENDKEILFPIMKKIEEQTPIKVIDFPRIRITTEMKYIFTPFSEKQEDKD